MLPGPKPLSWCGAGAEAEKAWLGALDRSRPAGWMLFCKCGLRGV